MSKPLSRIERLDAEEVLDILRDYPGANLGLILSKLGIHNPNSREYQKFRLYIQSLKSVRRSKSSVDASVRPPRHLDCTTPSPPTRKPRGKAVRDSDALGEVEGAKEALHALISNLEEKIQLWQARLDVLKSWSDSL